MVERMQCTDLISQDHVILRRVLDILDGMVKKLEDGERIEIADVTAILKFLRFFGDEYHQNMEERILFPALLRTTQQEGSLRQIFREHSEERAVAADIEAALNPKRGRAFVQSSRRLILLLRNHLDKEDACLPDIAERALSNEEDELVVAEFMKNRTQALTLVDFDRLEKKYTRKPQGTPLKAKRELARAQGTRSYT
jgi:hemerythrin-like domain-containing protein